MKYKWIKILANTTTNYGENLAKWGLEQVFWVVLLVGLSVAAFAASKKSWAAAGLTGAATAIACYFLKNPQKLADLGNAMAKTIGF